MGLFPFLDGVPREKDSEFLKIQAKYSKLLIENENNTFTVKLKKKNIIPVFYEFIDDENYIPCKMIESSCLWDFSLSLECKDPDDDFDYLEYYYFDYYKDIYDNVTTILKYERTIPKILEQAEKYELIYNEKHDLCILNNRYVDCVKELQNTYKDVIKSLNLEGKGKYIVFNIKNILLMCKIRELLCVLDDTLWSIDYIITDLFCDKFYNYFNRDVDKVIDIFGDLWFLVDKRPDIWGLDYYFFRHLPQSLDFLPELELDEYNIVCIRLN